MPERDKDPRYPRPMRGYVPARPLTTPDELNLLLSRGEVELQWFDTFDYLRYGPPPARGARHPNAPGAGRSAWELAQRAHAYR